MICHGHETWHPDPEFYYKRGGGPMMDMGPYYVTALVQLLGRGRRRDGHDQGAPSPTAPSPRSLTTERTSPWTWTPIFPGNILFSNGAIAQIFTTFDVHYARGAQARFEVYGTEGTLVVPDPNTFDGPVMLLRPEDQAAAPKTDPALEKKTAPQFYNGYKEIPLLYDYNTNSRALGLADMCKALRTGREHRANYQQQRHVLEIMTSFSKSCQQGAYIPLQTNYTRTAPMQNNPMHGILDD